MIFKTHTGEIITGERLQKALEFVGEFWIENAYAIYEENAYAAHVSEARKIENLHSQVAYGQRVKNGEIPDFTTWQRVNQELTGDCVALLKGSK